MSSQLRKRRLSDNEEPEEYDVEEILDRKWDTDSNSYLYKIKWQGYIKPTWESEENLTNCTLLLRQFFQKRHPNVHPDNEEKEDTKKVSKKRKKTNEHTKNTNNSNKTKSGKFHRKYEPKCIIDKMSKDGTDFYLVQWKGLSTTTWEPKVNLKRWFPYIHEFEVDRSNSDYNAEQRNTGNKKNSGVGNNVNTIIDSNIQSNVENTAAEKTTEHNRNKRMLNHQESNSKQSEPSTSLVTKEINSTSVSNISQDVQLQKSQSTTSTVSVESTHVSDTFDLDGLDLNADVFTVYKEM